MWADIRQKDVIQKSCSICTPALIVHLEFKLRLNDEIMWLWCVTAKRSGRRPPVHSCGSAMLVLLPFREALDHKEEKQQLPKGSFPFGQAAMPELTAPVNLAVTLTSLESLRLITSKERNQEKLCTDNIFKDRVASDSAAWLKSTNRAKEITKLWKHACPW